VAVAVAPMVEVVVVADSTAVVAAVVASLAVAVAAAPMVEAADTGKISVGSSKKARLLRQAGLFLVIGPSQRKIGAGNNWANPPWISTLTHEINSAGSGCGTLR